MDRGRPSSRTHRWSRRGHRSKLLPGSLLLLLFLLSCHPASRVSYVVGLAQPDSLSVRVTIEGAPRDSLILESYASTDILRPSDLRAVGPEGESLGAMVGVRTARTRARAVNVTRVLLPGPLPGRVQIQYRLAPSVREGNGHTGFSGKSFGELNGRFALLAGRNIFLVPRLGSDDAASVRFALPEGWRAVASSSVSGLAHGVGIHGKYGFENLIGLTIGLGRFRDRFVQIGRTRYCFSFESGIPQDEENRAVDRLGRVARYLRGLFGRDLGATYRTVVVPESSGGDEIEGDGWADGQGGTFAPLTTPRIHRFAARLLEAYLVYPPYRSEIRHPGEYWFVDGVRNLYAWRAVAKAGLMTDDDVTRETVAAYIQTLDASGVERNLERLYGSEENTRIGRDFEAPAALLCLEELVRTDTSGAERLDDVVGRMFRSRSASEIAAALPRTSRPNWETFRSRFVRGAEPFDVRGLVRLRAAHPSPDAPPAEPARRVTVIYTGDSHGFLENCGCKVNQAGGVARRATFLRRIRRSDPGALLVDAGNAFAEPVGDESPTYLSRREQELYLRTMDMNRYDAAAVGRTELLYGLQHFRDMTRRTTTPFLAANVARGGAPVTTPIRCVRRDGLDIAIIGVLDPPRGRAAGASFEERVADLSFDDPVETLRRNARALRDSVNLVVAIGDINPVTIRQIAARCPGVDIVVSSSVNAPLLVGTGSDEQATLEDVSGFLGRMLVLYTSSRQYGIQVARLTLDRGNRILSAEIEEERLDEHVPDDPRMREVLNGFYDEVGKVGSAQGSVPSLFAWDSSRSNGVYVGAARCRSCHEEEYSQWRSTQHAAAFKTLLDRHRHFQPRCVSCHVVGYGTRHGYRVGAPEEPLANVQCEVCHGPGGEHVRQPATSNVQRAVPERVCLECHTPDHSDAFSYAAKLPLVVHDRTD